MLAPQQLVRLRKISRDEPPVMTVESGATVHLDLPDFSGGLINQKSVASDLKAIDFSKGYALAGPIRVRGAKAGDILEVEFLRFSNKGWGYTAIFPDVEVKDLANYPEERFEPFIVKWDVVGAFAHWRKFGVRVPLNPFLGVVGTAPRMGGSFNPLPPRDCGGNLDVKHLVAGSRLYLPVNVDGADLFVGDPHLAMGDGEVYSSAIEAPLEAEFRVRVRDAADHIEPPMCVVPNSSVHKAYDRGSIGFMGVAKTLDEACEIASRKAMTYFCGKLGMTPAEAAILLGVVLDLTISEVPDLPNKVVMGMVPLSVFQGDVLP